MTQIKHTVSVASVYKQLVGTVKKADLEHAVNEEVKSQFEQAGIVFYDKPGLHPIPPSHECREKGACGKMDVITITQGRP